jgi:PII-like signaling protein
MRLTGEGLMLRVFVDENDELDGKPLAQEIVKLARSHGMSGATVLRGVMGYGANSLIHAVRQGIADDMPLVIEIVENEAKVKSFIPVLDKIVKEGLITLEKVNIIAYRTSKV